jgi:hypothetical protein
MISGKTRESLLLEIAKFGNVYLSCLKIGINASTYYRWKEKDELFREEADEAENDGRKNICHVAEHALLKNVKEGQQRAIEYTLNHNSEVYRRKEATNVVIVHKKESVTQKDADEKSCEEDLADLKIMVDGIRSSGLPLSESDKELIKIYENSVSYLGAINEECEKDTVIRNIINIDDAHKAN